MKLIVQNIGGTVYAYYEDEKHHKRIEPKRGGRRLDPSEKLPHECDMNAYEDSYFVFDVKRPPRRKKK